MLLRYELNNDQARRKIFIGGLSYNTDDEKLRNHFSCFGIIEDAVVMKDLVTNRSRGFGFVTFIDSESLECALAAPNPNKIDGRKVRRLRIACSCEILLITRPYPILNS